MFKYKWTLRTFLSSSPRWKHFANASFPQSAGWLIVWSLRVTFDPTSWLKPHLIRIFTALRQVWPWQHYKLNLKNCLQTPLHLNVLFYIHVLIFLLFLMCSLLLCVFWILLSAKFAYTWNCEICQTMELLNNLYLIPTSPPISEVTWTNSFTHRVWKSLWCHTGFRWNLLIMHIHFSFKENML